MKTLIALIIAGLFVLGCKDNPVDKLGTGAIGTMNKAEDAAPTANLSLLKSSIDSYKAANGNYPPTLQDAAAFSGTKIDEAKYNYDPSTGQVTPR